MIHVSDGPHDPLGCFLLGPGRVSELEDDLICHADDQDRLGNDRECLEGYGIRDDLGSRRDGERLAWPVKTSGCGGPTTYWVSFPEELDPPRYP